MTNSGAQSWLGVLRSVFKTMSGTGPAPLIPALEFERASLGCSDGVAEMLSTNAQDRASHIRETLHRALSEWDYVTAPDWASTQPNTHERRAEIYLKLQLPLQLQRVFDDHLGPLTSEFFTRRGRA